MVPNLGDAWTYTVAQVEGFFARGLARGLGAEQLPDVSRGLLELSEEEPSPLARELMGEYLDSARLLGRRTAEMQLALASLGDNPDFSPEPFSTLVRRSRYQSMRNKVRQVFEQLRKNRRDMEPSVRAEADRVIALEEQILIACRTFLDANIAACRIRHHGRFLLRELVYTGSDFLISSFEGDPSAPLSERRHKRAPMRDVVAMLRSFQYAAFAPLLGPRPATVPGPDMKHLEPLALYWQSWASSTFLRSYFEDARKGNFLPTDRGQLKALLHTYMLEEVVSGLGFEMAHRPEWVRIPLYAILEVLGAR
jgi:trehalose synthase-fused probable maltokinase